MGRMWDEAVRGWGEGKERCRAKRMPGTLMRARRVPLLKNTAVSKRRERERMKGIEKRKGEQRGFITEECWTTICKLRQTRVFVFFSHPHSRRYANIFFQVNMKINYTHTHRKYNLHQPDTYRNCLHVYESLQPEFIIINNFCFIYAHIQRNIKTIVLLLNLFVTRGNGIHMLSSHKHKKQMVSVRR